MAGPWERYQQQTAVPVNGPRGQDPVIAPPDPYKQAAEQRAQVSQDIQIQGANRADQALDLNRQQFEYRQQADVRPNPGAGYQLNPDGTAAPIVGGPHDKSADQRRNAEALLRAAGVDIAQGIDPVADLIRGSTSGRLQAFGARAYGDITGDATSGMENIGKLQTIASDLTLQMTGGSLGAQVSNSDRDFIVQRIGNIADPTVPADQRLAAWEQVKQRMANIAGVQAPLTTTETQPEDEGPPEGQVLLGYGQTDDGQQYPIYGYPSAPTGGGTPPSGGDDSFFRMPNSLGEFGAGLSQGADSIVRGASALPGVLINPVGQLMNDALGIDERYDVGDVLSRSLGLQRNQNQLADNIAQFASGGLTGGTAARALTSIAAPGGVASGVLNTLGRTPIRDTVAGAGAGVGAYAGQQSGIPGAEAAGALAGGLAGYGASGLPNALASLRGGGTSPLMQAADRQRVELLPSDTGGPAARAITAGTRASPLSVTPVVRQAQRQQTQMRDATNRVVQNQGGAVDSDLAGEAIRSAGQRFTQRTSQRASRLYDRANQAAAGVTIRPQQTIQRLDEYIARVQNDPSAPPGAVADLQRFRTNVENGVNVAGLRDARSRLSQGVYNGQLRSGAEQAMWKDILSNLSTDIDAGLRAANNNRAANLFRQADEFWKARVEHIDQVLEPILGAGKSGEDIVSAVEAMTRGGRGGNARLSRLLSEMNPDEAMNVRATVIDRLGRANPGAQNAEGNAYSSATFLTNWNKMTPQAKASLFPDSQLRRDLNDIATIADGVKQSQSMANFSNTGVAIGANVGVGTGALLTNPVTTLLGAGSIYLTGRLMASPRFARILAKTARQSPRAAQRTFTEELATLATLEPQLSDDIEQVQRAVSE